MFHYFATSDFLSESESLIWFQDLNQTARCSFGVSVTCQGGGAHSFVFEEGHAPGRIEWGSECSQPLSVASPPPLSLSLSLSLSPSLSPFLLFSLALSLSHTLSRSFSVAKPTGAER